MIKKNKLVKKCTKKLLVGVISTLLFASFHVSAAKQGHIEITSKVQKVVPVETANGEKTYELTSASKVLPNEVVQYSTHFKNISDELADGIQIVNPIPEHTVYLPNTAQGKNSDIVFSVDGGKQYGKAESLKVKGKDGKLHVAKPSDYTHIRWQYQGKLSPSEEQVVTFRVRLL